MRTLIVSLLMTVFSSALHAQTNRIDLIRPDAPELASFGAFDTGVRTVEVTDSNRPDVLNMRNGEDTPLYDRSLTLEIWYPAQLASAQSPGTQYQTRTRNPEITATLTGRSVRDADSLRGDARFPLVIISHGYPGNRYLLSHLGENLASKGYVVASIDHTDSTYEDQQNINSTLYNRAMDQRFVLSAIADFSETSDHFLSGVVDANNTGLIGYSMGGFGAVNNLGAGYSDAGVGFIAAPPNGLLNELAASNPDFTASLDPRIKAGVPIAPWGMNTGFWDAEGLNGIRVPTLFVAGDADTTSGYENGIKAIYDQAVNSDRYMLVFKNAGHSAAAPIPLPVEFLDREDSSGADHYTDPVWDTLRMNNILQHFVTAFLDLHLKGDADKASYLDLVEDGADGVYAMNPDGRARPNHTYWQGFGPGSAVGLKLYRN
ncbi:alpha/beta hydrolase family protein [Pseudohongiella sp.]|uniref:PET hydrolase/cutinase-like domain-containing protein n=1 Tax=marine sediment metagenome TaxID=412755 RepID=A0A0F9YAJ9_9ZZZZ|nr:dienelactone hydrolase [Pseudohongiella sp.]HDZ07915.1 dienelactone hydrolase [Pseudohongiella sp.]HEA64478.1 dienelactone hydrolase [Pseudohongiella sp.]